MLISMLRDSIECEDPESALAHEERIIVYRAILFLEELQENLRIFGLEYEEPDETGYRFHESKIVEMTFKWGEYLASVVNDPQIGEFSNGLVIIPNYEVEFWKHKGDSTKQDLFLVDMEEWDDYKLWFEDIFQKKVGGRSGQL